MVEASSVDRTARQRAATLFRAVILGRVRVEDFENEEPVSADPVIPAIWETAWLFYDDFRTERLTGQWRISLDQRRVFARWIMFLDSDLPYTWPDVNWPGHDPNTRIEPSPVRRFFFRSPDRLSPSEARAFLDAGHYRVWPFRTTADYKQALRHPRRLARAPLVSLLPETGAQD